MRPYMRSTTAVITPNTRTAPSGRMTDCTKAGSLSRANSALGGQSSMQLVYGLGTGNVSAMRSWGRKKSANTAVIAPTSRRSAASGSRPVGKHSTR